MVGVGVEIVAFAAFFAAAAGCLGLDISTHGKDGAKEWLHIFKEGVMSITGLALLIAVYIQIFLHHWILESKMIIGLVVTIFGLTFFLRGLNTGLMPLAENVGRELPMKIPLMATLAVCFVLGTLCTLAEPSIQALQTAGELVSLENAPYVYIVLAETFDGKPWLFYLKMAVGAGVGVAAVVGALRLLKCHGVKLYTLTTFIPPILITVVSQLFFSGEPDHLDRSTGLAWDCGGVTTGPVTVPIVLAIGIGMSSAAKAQAKAKAQGTAAVEPTRSVFGSTSQSPSLLIEKNVERRATGSMVGSLMSGLHSDSMAAKRGVVSFEVNRNVAADALAAAEGGASKADDVPSLDGFGIVTFASLLPAFTVWALTYVSLTMYSGSSALHPDDPTRLQAEPEDETFFEHFISALMGSVQAVGPLVGFLLLCQFVFVRKMPEGLFSMLVGCAVTLMGLVGFIVGLETSLTPIGNKAGELMPTAVDHYGQLGGDVVMLVFGFLAGVGATFSEPALSALGDTVHALTRGEFKKSSLILSVALGVGIGVVVGLMKIRYSLSLTWILVVMYAIAFGLTAVSEEAITCVAWDSAGVTTGEVTVPIILALGGSIAKAQNVAEGFGILACASFGPIIAVLAVAKLQEMSKRGKQVVLTEQEP